MSKLKVNTWYLSKSEEYSKTLCYRTGNYNNYGILDTEKNYWSCRRIPCSCFEDWEEADEITVRNYLISYAESIGVWEVPIIDYQGYKGEKSEYAISFGLLSNSLWSTYGNVFKDGKWATPLKQEKQDYSYLIGKKCKGFAFKETDTLHEMSKVRSCVGLVGVIDRVDTENDIRIKFEDEDNEWFPLDGVLKNLVEEEEKSKTFKEEAFYLIKDKEDLDWANHFLGKEGYNKIMITHVTQDLYFYINSQKHTFWSTEEPGHFKYGDEIQISYLRDYLKDECLYPESKTILKPNIYYDLDTDEVIEKIWKEQNNGVSLEKWKANTIKAYFIYYSDKNYRWELKSNNPFGCIKASTLFFPEEKSTTVSKSKIIPVFDIEEKRETKLIEFSNIQNIKKKLI